MIRTHVLDSGTTVLIDEMRDVRSFALGVFVRAGSGDEPPSRQGMSHFLEHLLPVVDPVAIRLDDRVPVEADDLVD